MRTAFAVPGDLMSVTGGYIYDSRVIDGLRRLGRDVMHVALGGSFPDPTVFDLYKAAKMLAALPPDCPVIIDGLALGAMPLDTLTDVAAPIVALVHHPLAHEGGLDTVRRDQLLRTERASLRRAAHVIVPSPHTAAILMSDYGVSADRITIARPGTDRPTVAAAKADPPLILSVGIQVPRKGHDVVLQALAQITDLSWQAIIVGAPRDPAYATRLAQLVAAPELVRRVTLAGQVPQHHLQTLYAQARIFALATRHEGYGIVFDEAMAHGLPIVSCQTGAVPDTVAKGAGLLVPPDDTGAFAGAVAQMLQDTHQRDRMSAASSAAGAALPGWDHTATVFDNVLTAVLLR